MKLADCALGKKQVDQSYFVPSLHEEGPFLLRAHAQCRGYRVEWWFFTTGGKNIDTTNDFATLTF